MVVAKGAKGGIATSDVSVVTDETRRREVARMLGDPDMTTALEHAAELLKELLLHPEHETIHRRLGHRAAGALTVLEIVKSASTAGPM